MSAITGITFVETASGNADLHFASKNIDGPAYAGITQNRLSWTTQGGEILSCTVASYVYLDNVEHAAANAAPTPGTFGFETLLHEIGHAMGLKHPFEGVNRLSAGEDNSDHTLMSYTRTAPHADYSAYDVAALQYLYGTDGLNGQGRGSLSTGDFVVAVAPGANDAYTGTAGSDYANLGSGNDIATLLDGNDAALGLDGSDVLYGNAGADVLYGNQGNDSLYGGKDSDQVFGGQGDDEVNGNMGDDQVFGNLGNDVCYGGQGNDVVRGGQGNDLVFGNLGDDALWGDLGNDTLTGNDGADIFCFAAGFGHDAITDFTFAQGDRIGVAGGLSYSIGANGAGDAVIAFADGSDVLLSGIKANQVGSDWFVAV